MGLLKEGGSQLKEQQVSAKELPYRLLKEFSLFNRGLIPNLTMASIAVLRESTAHILAKLNANLDGPFLTHKSLLQTPYDATNYASEIVASELRSIIHKHRIADELLSDEIIKSFVDQKTPAVLKYLNAEGTEVETEINTNTLNKMIADGLGQLDKTEIDAINLDVCKDGNDVKTEARSIIAESLSSFLTLDRKTASSNNFEFLRVTNLAADKTSKVYFAEEKGGNGKMPSLQLGTIVKLKGNFLLCLQPSCDSVRVNPKGQPFLFINLAKDTAPKLVVLDRNKLVGLTYKPNIKNSLLIKFKQTDDETETVKAVRNVNKFNFIVESENRGGAPTQYEWIAELKLDVARKIAQELANQYSRIGLDEFELSRIGWKYQ